MKKTLDKFVRFCPKTGKFRGFKPLNGLSRLLFPFIGLIALIWILIRVIPKPSRINYPCVKTAMPFATGFISYLILLGASALAFIRSRKTFYKSRTFYAGACLLFGLCGSYYFISDSAGDSLPQIKTAYHEPNKPIGEAKGIFPGRVVWVYNPNATNENCNPKSNGHSYYMNENNNQPVIDSMLSIALHAISGKNTDLEAWNAIFAYHNNTRGKGAVNYKKGEKIFIKMNATSSWAGNFKTSDLSPSYPSTYYAVSETTPQIVLAVLRQLVNVVGVDQTDIYLGDPMKHIYKHFYEILHPEFPNIHYLDHDANYKSLGREQAPPSSTAILTYSDKGTVLRTSSGQTVYTDYLYKIFEDAEYILNIPQLKGHKRAGVTMFAKNHLGSQTRAGADHMHNGLVAPDEKNITRPGYGLYRIQVDLMTHDLLRVKNLMYLMDALWATDYELDIPLKWKMAPFNNDWMSSIFISQDPVAIESVGFDFLRTEFTVARGAGTFVQMEGTDDYLHQAADSANWPKGIKYDPNNNGKYIATLGVHEHWNNETDRKYSRNLGTGNGIELVKADMLTSVSSKENPVLPEKFVLYSNYPNPFNPSTTIKYFIPYTASIKLKIFDISGREIQTLVDSKQQKGYHEVKFNAQGLSSGVYLYQLSSDKFETTRKLLLQK